MKKILIASHGRFASGIKSSLDVLLGSVDNVTVIDAYLDQSRVQDHVDTFYETVYPEDQVILMSDLYGGSVNQVLFMYLDKPNTFLISGINLALVLELAASGEDHIELQQLEAIIEESRKALILVRNSQNEAVQEDFF